MLLWHVVCTLVQHEGVDRVRLLLQAMLKTIKDDMNRIQKKFGILNPSSSEQCAESPGASESEDRQKSYKTNTVSTAARSAGGRIPFGRACLLPLRVLLPF